MPFPPHDALALLLETHTDAVTCAFHASELIASGTTAWQRYEVVRVPGFGKVLFLDGKTQSGQVDEHIYHEVLVHPAMFLHPAPRRVLICGGGEGATLREALRHPSVEEVVQLDIDGELIEVARAHLPEWHRGSFDDPRAKLIIGDARAYIEACEAGSFDVVISDLPNPMEDGPATRLFTREFFAHIARILSPRGAFAMQAGSAALTHAEFLASVGRTVGDVFPFMCPCIAHVATYMEPWGFVVAGKASDLRDVSVPALAEEIRARGLDLAYYGPETHVALASPPAYVLDGIAAVSAPSTDDNPIIWTA